MKTVTTGGLYKNPTFGYQCMRPDGSMFIIGPNELFLILEAVSGIGDHLRCAVLTTQGNISKGVFLNAGDLEEAKET
jgi:hypothetical protein